MARRASYVIYNDANGHAWSGFDWFDVTEDGFSERVARWRSLAGASSALGRIQTDHRTRADEPRIARLVPVRRK